MYLSIFLLMTLNSEYLFWLFYSLQGEPNPKHYWNHPNRINGHLYPRRSAFLIKNTSQNPSVARFHYDTLTLEENGTLYFT